MAWYVFDTNKIKCSEMLNCVWHIYWFQSVVSVFSCSKVNAMQKNSHLRWDFIQWWPEHFKMILIHFSTVYERWRLFLHFRFGLIVVTRASLFTFNYMFYGLFICAQAFSPNKYKFIHIHLRKSIGFCK